MLVILSVLEEVGIAYLRLRLNPNCCFIAMEERAVLGENCCCVRATTFPTCFGKVMMPTGVTQRMGYVKKYKHNRPAQ